MLMLNYLFHKRTIRMVVTYSLLSSFVPMFAQSTRGNLMQNTEYRQLYNACLDSTANTSLFDVQCFAEALQKKYPADQHVRALGTIYAMVKREHAFDLESAIGITELTLELGQQMKDLVFIGKAYQDLYRFQDALGNKDVAMEYLELATQTWEQAGRTGQVLRNRYTLLEDRAKFQPIDSIYQEMLLLVDKAEAIGDQDRWEYLHNRMSLFTLNYEMYDEAERHLDALAIMAAADSMGAPDYGNAIIHARGMALVAQARNKFTEAEEWFQKSLALAREQPSPWLEVMLLLELADLEWANGNPDKSEGYLDRAEVLALEREMYDLLTTNYDVRYVHAEALNDYKSALEYYQKKVEYESIFQARSEGFDLKNAILEQEKQELALEKQRQDLALQKREYQLQTALGFGLLALLLVVMTAWGLVSQRRKKQQLARQNEVIKEQAERLSNLDALKSRFFANASHELRTPLGLILGPLKSLEKEGTITSRQNQLVDIAKKAGQQMNQLINDILDLTKMDDQHLSVNTKPTPLASFLATQCHSWLESGEQQGKSFAYKIDIPRHLQVALDRRKVQQVLNNLLSNAFKFTPSGGSITVEAQELKGQMQVIVRDTGEGISQEDLPYIFDRYFQSNDPQKVTTGGSGIGLALSRELAELMGGSVKVQSTLDQGAEFRLVLPLIAIKGGSVPSGKEQTLQRAYRHGEVAKAAQTRPVVIDRPEILVVDDNADLRRYLEMILKPAYHLILTANGEEAITHLRKAKKLPDLILTDLMMPVLDGFGLIDAVKKEPALRHLPFIMLTARAQERTKLRALRVGVDDYVTLPFDEQELLARIDNVLAHQAVRRSAVHSSNGSVHPQQKSEPAEQLSEADQNWLQDFEAFAKKNLGEGTFSVPRLAQEFAMSESTLLRQLKRLTGLTPVKYLQELRLDRARELMEENSEVSVQKVASEIGYQDVRSFSRIFKKRFGISPSEYLQAN
jgi:signal transduction histidine kinase/DNA-binding response OmpR family regulator